MEYNSKLEFGLFQCQNLEESGNLWVSRLLRDEVVLLIVKTAAFRRLADVSFLGALDYTWNGRRHLVKEQRSRAYHSLHVAALAAYISHKRGYSEDVRRHLVVAALLHDVGHPPLSHSAEPFIKRKLGYGHHEAGEELIRGAGVFGAELKKVLDSVVDLRHILDLLNKNAVATDGGDLFSNKINIDTIDGIIRSHSYLIKDKNKNLSLKVASASFLGDGDCADDRQLTLDLFWQMKNFVYGKLIHNDIALLSDKTSELFFQEFGGFESTDFLCTERTWKKRFPKLFIFLKNVADLGQVPHFLEDEPINFTRRNYVIGKSQDLGERYIYHKTNSIRKFEQKDEAWLDKIIKMDQRGLGL